MGRVIPAILLLVVLCQAPPSWANEWAAKLPVGSNFPQINAEDQSGRVLGNSNLHGSNGMLFVFVRSTNW